jgi:hypothetical protein
VKSALNEILWESEGFALAVGYDEAAKKFVGLAVPHVDQFAEVTDSTLLVAPGIARAQRDQDETAAVAMGLLRPGQARASNGPPATPDSGAVQVTPGPGTWALDICQSQQTQQRCRRLEPATRPSKRSNIISDRDPRPG